MGWQIPGERGSGQWDGRRELEGSRDVSSWPCTVAQDPFQACPGSIRARQLLLAPRTPFSLWLLFPQPSRRFLVENGLEQQSFD